MFLSWETRHCTCETGCEWVYSEFVTVEVNCTDWKIFYNIV